MYPSFEAFKLPRQQFYPHCSDLARKYFSAHAQIPFWECPCHFNLKRQSKVQQGKTISHLARKKYILLDKYADLTSPGKQCGALVQARGKCHHKCRKRALKVPEAEAIRGAWKYAIRKINNDNCSKEDANDPNYPRLAVRMGKSAKEGQRLHIHRRRHLSPSRANTSGCTGPGCECPSVCVCNWAYR